MLKLVDILFLWLHIVIILFNLFGWIWIRTRKWHFWLMIATIFSWLVLGIKYGLGYCFLTDWHWDIKRKLDETNLPNSFVKYFLDNYTPWIISPNTVDFVTGIGFSLAIILTVYVNFLINRIPRGSASG